MINRCALIVRPAQPYIDWALGLDDSGVAPEPDSEVTIYLVPEFENDSEAEDVLELVYTEVFERELAGWHTDEAAWPVDRSLAAFKRWFKIEMHSVVEDLCADPLLDDEGG
jgi:hypothetical protein